MNRRSLSVTLSLLILLTLVSAALSFYNLRQQLPFDQWHQALWQPSIDNVNQMMFHYSTLPRVAVALLAGASLGLVGLLFQQVLRNPLAEPATLGVSAGGAAWPDSIHFVGPAGRRADTAICRDDWRDCHWAAGVWHCVG
ncbi:Iron(III)-hydroxamate import system permease protein fhuB [Ewingella americana]|uniref:Iron(III)-hydroxamate import system permease protein fhuB n=1 Tax=Ewingella americana TaxID=41202 RepID=A0A377NHH2_9GAMM|nr:Iron(III)-hydroxamate import system permease protein fhuB [Ewingella americana]